MEGVSTKNGRKNVRISDARVNNQQNIRFVNFNKLFKTKSLIFVREAIHVEAKDGDGVIHKQDE